MPHDKGGGDEMARYLDCPFCGQRGERTKEHVWAQWLHETAGAQALLDSTHGERIPREFPGIRKDADGRYQRVVEILGSYAKWLPNIKVDVCKGCNGGWMSVLENQVGSILSPLIDGGSPVRLTVDDLRTLTTWATKSWMAYALTRPEQQNPFTEDEYRGMAASPGPLGRSLVWLLHSDDGRAQVSMGMIPQLLVSAGLDLRPRGNASQHGLCLPSGLWRGHVHAAHLG